MQALGSCPRTRVVLSGYSQGAQVVHNSVNRLPTSTIAQISSVVLFGDPDSPQPVVGIPSSRQLNMCHLTDHICHGGDLVTLPHFTYAGDVKEAAEFVTGNL